jgi:hypothetical protein
VRSGGVRLGVTGSVRRRGVGWRGVKSCGVGEAAWGRVGGTRSVRRAGRTHVKLVGWAHGGRLDCRVKVMDLWSITLGDEYRRPIYTDAIHWSIT